MRRVVVTGLGAICALGHRAGAMWEALQSGQGGIGPISAVDTSALRFKNGAEVRAYRPEEHFPEGRVDFLDRFAQFGVLAAREAVRDAGLRISPRTAPRIGVIVGSCVGGQTTQDAGFHELYRLGRSRVHPLTIPKTMANAAASHICMELGVTGPAMTISTACSSSNHAIGQALWWMRSGQVDCALAGGAEAPFSLGILKAWEAMRVVSPDTCRPFSADRSGMILGEGAAMLVLEPLDAAMARGAKIYAELAGFGMSSDAGHLTDPSAEGAALAMRNALADAAADASAVGYVNAHGTATLANDVTEARAMREVFGAHARDVFVSSTKSMHGHALGAAGALEAAATVLALHHRILPPTANFTALDPLCGELNLVASPTPVEVDLALSNSFAFGGLNAVLAFRRAGV